MRFIEFPEISFPIQGLEDVRLPQMYRVRELYENDEIADISGALTSELEGCGLEEGSLSGKTIAITVGSRGIPGLVLMIRTLCDWLKARGAEPFIVPAMGSHGGGTVAGNLEIINGYGITEESTGVPIRATMEVDLIGSLPDRVQTPVYCDRFAAQADGIILFNKVKPHTDFKGYVESGLCKMMAIGLAKHKGCSMFHEQGFDTFADRVPMAAKVFLEKKNVICGIGVVQNAYDNISEIRAYKREDIIEGDHELLEIARRRLPKLKFDNIDVLIIDRIGKNISGEGADPNVTGRGFMPYFKDDFHAKRLLIRGLSEQSHHNACGLGLADVTTRRCLNDVDWESTWINLTTNMMVDGGKIPMYQNTDREAILLAIRSSIRADYKNPRIARIRDTLSLSEIEISEALLMDVKDRSDVEILSGPCTWEFDGEGYMRDLEISEG